MEIDLSSNGPRLDSDTEVLGCSSIQWTQTIDQWLIAIDQLLQRHPLFWGWPVLIRGCSKALLEPTDWGWVDDPTWNLMEQTLGAKTWLVSQFTDLGIVFACVLTIALGYSYDKYRFIQCSLEKSMVMRLTDHV